MSAHRRTAVLVSTPRKQRKLVKAQCGRVETVLEEALLPNLAAGRLPLFTVERIDVHSRDIAAIKSDLFSASGRNE